MKINHERSGLMQIAITYKNGVLVFDCIPEDKYYKLGNWKVRVPNTITGHFPTWNKGFRDCNEIVEYVARFEN